MALCDKLIFIYKQACKVSTPILMNATISMQLRTMSLTVITGLYASFINLQQFVPYTFLYQYVIIKFSSQLTFSLTQRYDSSIFVSDI